MSTSRFVSVLFVLLFSVSFLACSKKRISYTEMVNREAKEISYFFQSEGIQVVDNLPEGKVTDAKTFVKLLEGVYVRIINPGTTAPISGKTIVHARCKLRSISPRSSFSYDNLSGNTGGTPPISFVYNLQRETIIPDPDSSFDELSTAPLACSALQEAMKYVGDGGEFQLLTTFREGPALSNREGLPSYYERVTVHFKR